MRQRITPYEWLHLGGAAAFSPFAIQLQISLPVLPPPERLEEALVVAAEANPGARFVAAGWAWRDGGVAPRVRVIDEAEVFSLSHPLLRSALPAGKAAIEVLHWQGMGLIFRCAHALMDAAGLLFFAQESFRALRGDTLLGSSTLAGDRDYLEAETRLSVRPWPARDQPSPLGEVKGHAQGFVWERGFVPGCITPVAAHISAAIANQSGLRGQACFRVMMPVNLRLSDRALRTTRNLSTPLLLDLPVGGDWHRCYGDMLAALGRHDERPAFAFDAFSRFVPRRILGAVFDRLQRRQVAQNGYLFSAVVSSVGPVPLQSFRFDDCEAGAVSLLPFDIPGSALSIQAIQHDNGTEIAASCPLATGGDGRLQGFVEKLCESLRNATVGGAEAFSSQYAASRLIAVASSFVAEPMEEVLAYWMRRFGVPCDISFAPYNQILQSLLDPAGAFLSNKGGVNLLLMNPADWLRDVSPGISLQERIDMLCRNADEFISIVRGATTKMSVPLVIWIAPPLAGTHEDIQGPLRSVAERITNGLDKVAGIHLIAPDQAQQGYVVSHVANPHADRLAHVPYSREMYAALATQFARKLIALWKPPCKVVVLDADNTLWQGACGELGASGVVVTAEHRFLQQFMLALEKRGVLLCLCSKNDPEDVAAVFMGRTDMLLQQEHFVATRINWHPKSHNLQAIAAELRLGLDSFVFIDDSPVECAEIRANCPAVQVLQLPESSGQIAGCLQNFWAFDEAVIAPEAGLRTRRYQEERLRDALRSEAGDFGEFLRSLGLQLDLIPPGDEQRERVAELTRRTNQFNMRPVPCQLSELPALIKGGRCLAVEVRDRFGAYGLTGALVYHVQADTLLLDSFMLSCRVLGRGVEHRVLAELARIARNEGCRRVAIAYRRTARNRPALDFLEAAGHAVLLSDEGVVSLSVDQAMQLQAVAGEAYELTAEGRSSAFASGPFVSKPGLFEAIANEAGSVDKILEVVAAGRASASARIDEYLSQPDRALVAHVRTLIDLEVVPFDQSLIALGLDSVGVVSLLAFCVESMAPDLTPAQLDACLDDFIRNPTLNGLKASLLVSSSAREDAVQQLELDA
ncbi:MAG: HAD-IIIC family phosphatase [Rhodocyclaceae bacterium]